MTMLNPDTGWFETFEIPMLELSEVTAGNDEYIDKSYVRVIQLLNNT